jgi:uncharacterized protein affecting Mg2+/Co2+ transport
MVFRDTQTHDRKKTTQKMMLLTIAKRRLRCYPGINISTMTDGERPAGNFSTASFRRDIFSASPNSLWTCGSTANGMSRQKCAIASHAPFPNGLKTIGRQGYHTTLDLEEDRIRRTTLRLYRVLQRSCTVFDTKAPGNDSILLQPILEAPDWGHHATYTPPASCQIDDLYRLFYVWNDSADDRGLGVFSPGEGGNEGTATPITRTTTTMMTGAADHPSSMDPVSSIDRWYYELLTKADEELSNQEEDDDEDGMNTSLSIMPSMTCWSSQKQIREAIRTAFRTLNYEDGAEQGHPTKLTSKDLHKWAIKAFQILNEQQILWSHSSVATTDGLVRIVATSRCIGTAFPAPTTMPPSVTTPQILADASPKYRFAYRIRVENVSDDQTIQLLGRYWHIAEEPIVFPGMEGGPEAHPPIIVDSPKTGAVGQLPVLQPGQVFEYMSGTDLATPRGTMRGHLYMARVPSTAKSAQSGDHVETNETMFFEAEVAPFQLKAE